MKVLSGAWDWLDGKKTFIGGIVVFIAGGLKAIGQIDEATFEWLSAIGASIAVVGIRFALKGVRGVK